MGDRLAKPDCTFLDNCTGSARVRLTDWLQHGPRCSEVAVALVDPCLVTTSGGVAGIFAALNQRVVTMIVAFMLLTLQP